MTQGPHPLAYERLVAFAFDELGEGEAASVAAHIAHCPACSASVLRLRSLLDVLRTTEQEAPDAASKARVRRIFQFQPGILPYPQKQPRRYSRSEQVRLALAVTLLVIISGATGAQQVAAAAQTALPGDQWYPVKGVLAELQMTVTFNQVDRAELRLAFVEQHMEEILALAELGRYEDIPQSVDGYRAEIDAAAVALRVVARNNRAAGLVLVHQAEEGLRADARHLAELGDAGPRQAQAIIQEAVHVSETGQAIVRAQLSAQALQDLEALAATLEAPSHTPSPGHTATPVLTRTPAAATETPRPTASEVPPSATATLPPSATATAVPSETSTGTAPPATDTPLPSASPSATLPPTRTATPSPTITPTVTAPPTATKAPSVTPPENTATPTPTASSTITPTPTNSPTETGTPSPTPTPTATVNGAPHETPNPELDQLPTPTPTPTTASR